jgi:hypothetical protein
MDKAVEAVNNVMDGTYERYGSQREWKIIKAHIAQHAELIAKLRELAFKINDGPKILRILDAHGYVTGTNIEHIPDCQHEQARCVECGATGKLDAQPVLTSKSTVINNESRESP